MPSAKPWSSGCPDPECVRWTWSQPTCGTLRRRTRGALIEAGCCCGGGGGLNGIGLYRKERNIGLKNKLDQIRATGAELVITPCHNCWDAIRDMMEVYEEHNIKWSFLKPLLVDMMVVPPHIRHNPPEGE